MSESMIDLKFRVKGMSDKEIANELYGMRILAICVFRNDDGVKHDEEYRSFHQYLRLLKREASKRGIPVKKSGKTIPVIATSS